MKAFFKIINLIVIAILPSAAFAQGIAYHVKQTIGFSKEFLIANYASENRESPPPAEFFLVPKGSDFLRIGKLKGKLGFRWTEISRFTARFSLNILYIDPTLNNTPDIDLEGIYLLYADQETYIRLQKLKCPELKVTEDDNSVSLAYPELTLTAIRHKHILDVAAKSSKSGEATYTANVKEDATKGLIDIKMEFGKGSFPLGFAMTPFSIKNLDLKDLSLPILNFQFVVFDSRFSPTLGYLYMGDIPSTENSEKMYALKFPAEWESEISDFYLRQERPPQSPELLELYDKLNKQWTEADK